MHPPGRNTYSPKARQACSCNSRFGTAFNPTSNHFSPQTHRETAKLGFSHPFTTFNTEQNTKHEKLVSKSTGCVSFIAGCPEFHGGFVRVSNTGSSLAAARALESAMVPTGFSPRGTQKLIDGDVWESGMCSAAGETGQGANETGRVVYASGGVRLHQSKAQKERRRCSPSR